MSNLAAKAGSPRLVILGAGYVGRSVALEGLRRGWLVSALTWNAGDAQALRSAGVDPVVEAPVHQRDWHRFLSPADAWVLNCVGSGRGGLEGYRESYLEGMRSMADWAASRGGAEAAIFTGSTSVYGQDNGQWVSEKDEATGGEERGAVLREAEACLLNNPGIAKRRMVLRLGGIYGPKRAFLLQRARQADFQLEDSDHIYLNSIRLEDICEAVVTLCLTHPNQEEARVLNLVDDHPVLKSKILLGLRARLLEMGLPEEKGKAPGRRRASRPNRRISNALIKNLYGWNPRYPSWKEGYADLLGDTGGQYPPG